MAKINVQGRRMVQEDKIAKIGEGGGSYTAGNGINITNDEISVDETVVQGKLTAGSGISIENDVISATGGVSIDEETIIEDEVTGKIKTAVGGYTEIKEIDLDPSTLDGTGSDWDLVDQTLCESYLAVLEVGVHYPISLAFTGTTVPSPGIKSAEIYVESNEVSGGFGAMNSMFITDNDDTVHTWKFSVKENGYNIHVWPADSWVSPSSESTITITFLPAEIIHKIDKKYLDELSGGIGIEINNNKIDANIYGYSPLYVSGINGYNYLSLNIDKSTLKVGTDDKLSTVLGGGYSTETVPVTTSDFTADGSDYTCSNQTFNDAFLGTIARKAATEMTYGFALEFQDAGGSTGIGVVIDGISSVGNIYTITVGDSNVLATGYNTITYDANTNTVTASSIKYTSTFYNTLSNNNITGYILTYPEYAQVIVPIEAKFIPIDNSTITVDGNGKLTASGGSGSTKYTHNIVFSLYDNAQSRYVVESANITLVSSSSSQLGTYGEFSRLVYANNNTSMLASGVYDDGTNKGIILSVAGTSSGNQFTLRIYKFDGTESYITFSGQYAFTLNEDSVL